MRLDACHRMLRLISLPVLTLLVGLLLPAAARADYAALVIDAETGQVLHAESADTRNYPASLTKMMTLYMAFDALKAGKLTLDRRLPVSKRAASMAPSKLGLPVGSSIRVEDAILALVTKSANDVAVVMAEAIGGTEARFAQMMTTRARQLGMTRTTFRNASGLPNAGQLTTARDFARLGQALIQDHPQFYRYFSTASFTYEGETHVNHNHLMARYEGMDGLKTGFINASGFNLVGSAVRNGRRLIAVVMGGTSGLARDNRMAELLDYAFDHSEVVVAGAEPVRPPVRLAKAPVFAPVPDRKPTGQGDADSPSLSLTGTAIAASAAPALAAPPSGWGVQVGAFADRAAGENAISRAVGQASRQLSNAVPNIIEVATDKGPLYRARLVGLDEPTARAACAALVKAGASCLTVPASR